jgi:hypothetical protein
MVITSWKRGHEFVLAGFFHFSMVFVYGNRMTDPSITLLQTSIVDIIISLVFLFSFLFSFFFFYQTTVIVQNHVLPPS